MTKQDILHTKLFIPPPRPDLVLRPRLFEELNEGLQRKLTLVSAPAGFGKTTLVSEWVDKLRSDGLKGSRIENRVGWLSLDESDSDPVRFLTYFIAALNRVEGIEGTIGKGALRMLHASRPQAPPTEAVITALVNEVAAIPDRIILVLDDYHIIESSPVDDALTFILDNLPSQMHLVIATRDDPQLPLARLRARGQLTEIRAADLRFTSSEAAEFLNRVMGLDLLADDINALENRTEGWIVGLQLAAISLQGLNDATSFIKSFTGSHRFVLDYLMEEVLEKQSESVQSFLMQTSILDRLTGSLCDALTGRDNGQQALEYLEQSNLFIVPLDNERRWYRYHHLFADLLRQRLHQSAASSTGDAGRGVAELHKRASVWYENNGLEIEAFHHAAAANDVEHAARLIEGDGMPLPFRGAVAPVLNWLESLPTTVLDAKPLLWAMYASVLMAIGQTAGVEKKLQAAEAALQGAEPDDKTRDLVGRIAATRATLALTQHQAETIIDQSRRALAYLNPDNLPHRTATTWKLGYAYQLQGDRAAASQAYTEAISISLASGNIVVALLASTGLGNVQEAANQLHLAAQTYQRVIQQVGDPPLPAAASEAHLGLACIHYEWNDLDAARQHGQQSVQLARQLENTDRFIACEVFLARLKLAEGDTAGAAAMLAMAEQLVHQHNFVYRMPEVAAAKVLSLLQQGNLAAAARLAQTHKLPLSQARVHLAQGDTLAALRALGPLRRRVEAKGWEDERLRVMVLQAVALHAHGEKEQAVQLLGDALALAEPGGFIRTFVDEGPPMAHLLCRAQTQGIAPDYVRRLLAAFPVAEPMQDGPMKPHADQSGLIETLSERELEVLQHIEEGFTNREIADQLYLSLNTVKVHTRNIYGKLGVKNRTQAVSRARDLGVLLSS
jgi:LuxR family maltose regulon positive regulatory protein